MTQNIDSILISFNVYGSTAIVFHKEITINNSYVYQKYLSLLLEVLTSNIVLWPSINCSLRHNYDTAATDDLVVTSPQAGF